MYQQYSDRELDVSGNPLQRIGVTAISIGVGDNHGLEHLDLSCTNFTTDCIVHLCRALTTNKTLTSIDIEGSVLEEKDALQLLECLKNDAGTHIQKCTISSMTDAKILKPIIEIVNKKTK